ncbi:MAG: TRAP transporter small permease subunit [Pseudomonadota bacterium]
MTLNSLSDLQWYLLALVALVSAGVILLRNEHVRVDFLYSNLGYRGKTVIDVLGHLMFALPFLVFIIPDAWELATKSFTRGEASPNGGLIDRYLPRAAIPVGFALLLFAILFETWRNLRNGTSGDD